MGCCGERGGGSAVAVPHARRGRALEELVELVLSVYEGRGVAVVRRVPDPWKVVRRPGKAAEAYPVRKGLVDYLGVWRGRAVAFDCKETAGRFEFGKVPEHQLEFLSGWERCGGLAGFAVWFSRAEVLVWVPVGACLEVRASGKKSLSLEECVAVGVRVPAGPGVPFDLEAAWECLARGRSEPGTPGCPFAPGSAPRSGAG